MPPTDMATTTNHYLLLFRDPGDPAYLSFSPEQRQHLLERWTAWIEELSRCGAVADGHPLEAEGCLVSGRHGERVSDRLFSEDRLMIGGYLLLRVPDLHAATTIAQQCPGLAYGLTVEVRPTGESCPRLKPTTTRAPMAEPVAS